MATPSRRFTPPVNGKPNNGAASPKQNCWQKLLQKIRGQKNSQVQDGNGEHTTNTGTTTPDHKQHGGATKENVNINGGHNACANLEKNNKNRDDQVPNPQYQKGVVKQEDGRGSLENGKIDAKPQETLSSSYQDAKTNLVGILEPGQSLENKQANRGAIPEGKSSGNPGDGDKKIESKQPEALGSSDDQGTKTKSVGSLKPVDLLRNKQENSWANPAKKNEESPEVGDRKRDSKLPETLSSSVPDAEAKTGNSPKSGHLVQSKQQNSCGSPTDNSNGITAAGDKKMALKLPEPSGSSDQDAKTKPVSSLKPGHLLPNRQENWNASPAEKSKGSPGVEDGNLDSKPPEILGRSVPDAKTKTGSTLEPGNLLQNKVEGSDGSRSEKGYGIPGVGERKMDRNLPEALASSDKDAKRKPVSSLKPGHLLQNKQENGYASTAEKSGGSPGVGDRKIDSKLPETSGSCFQDAKAETGSSLKPSHLLRKKQENNYGSPGIRDKKVDSKLPEALGSSYQDSNAKTVSSVEPGNLWQNKQENSYGSPGVGDKKVDSKTPEALRSSDRDVKTKPVSSVKPAHLLQNKQENISPEHQVHKPSPKGDARQEDINKNGKDPKPQKVTISGFENSSDKQQKPGLKPENISESQAKKFNGSTEQAGIPPKNVKQKAVVKQPSLKNKDEIHIETDSLKTTKISSGYTLGEQQEGVAKQANNNESQINTRESSSMITDFSSHVQGGQFVPKEQQRTIIKQGDINKNDKNAEPSYTGNTGQASKVQQKEVQKEHRSYESHRETGPDPTKATTGGSGQQAAGIPLSNQQKGILKQEDIN